MHLPNSTEAANRAVIYSDPGTLKTEIVDLPIPKPGHGEILVRLYGSHSTPLTSSLIIIGQVVFGSLSYRHWVLYELVSELTCSDAERYVNEWFKEGVWANAIRTSWWT